MDSGAGHVGPERRTGLGRDSRDHGDGLQKMLSELCALYKQESGKQLTEVYSGTIGQSLAQYKAGSGVSVFVSDRQTLEDSDVSFASFQPLGTAVLVLAWKRA